jgi:hypothetical protein
MKEYTYFIKQTLCTLVSFSFSTIIASISNQREWQDISLLVFTRMHLQTKQLNSGMIQTCSTMTCGLAVPQMHMLYRFTLSDKWNVASSLNTMLCTKQSVSICMTLQNCSRRSWSLPNNCRLLGLIVSLLYLLQFYFYNPLNPGVKNQSSSEFLKV